MTQVSRSVGHYEILREIGRGGMARVYLAHQTDLDRNVALKELSAFHASDPQFAQRFLRESRLAGSLSHPNIVTVLEYFEHDGTPFIAMEYVARGSLRPSIGRLSLAQVVGVIEGMLAGLTHAESRGIVHRDLKPENVMVTDEGRVKIADFGIAKAGADAATGQFMTATGTTVGTPAYMAPEQAMAREIGPWTDLYSLGVMAYEMLVGKLPFPDNEAPMVMLMRHVNEPIPPPRSVNPELDEELGQWIERLLAKDPGDRVRSAAEAWDELEETVIRIFGARWRREARLPAPAAASDVLSPLTPAPFSGATPEALAEAAAAADPGLAPSGEFQSFQWGKAAPVPPLPAEGAAAGAAPAEPATPTSPTGPAATEPATPAESPASAYETAAAMGGAVAEPAAPAAAGPAEAAAESATPTEPTVEEPAATEPEPEPVPEPKPDFRTYGHRTPPPAPAPVEEVVPEPEPEPEWGATVAPSVAAPPPTPPAPVAAAPEPAAKGGASRGAMIGLGVVVLLIAAVVGFLVAPSSKSTKKTTPPPNVASGGVMSINFPNGWRQAAAAPSVPGLDLKDGIALGGPEAGATIVAGSSEGDGPTLLPAAFLARLSAPPKPEAVRLGATAAYRYTNLKAGSPDQTLTVYAVPTDHGTVTLACVGAAAVASPDCEAIATTLRLRGATALPLGPSDTYAKVLSDTIATLNSGVAAGSNKLGQAHTRAGQRSAANDLRSAYLTAATALGQQHPSPADASANTALAAALRKTAGAFRVLGSAAGSGDAAAYKRAAAAAARDQAAIAKAINNLRALGYTVAG
jgi:hypothetical protein